MSRYLRLAAFSVCSFVHSAAAQEPPSLTLHAAVTEALQRNPELAALRLDEDAARAAPLQERGLPPPMLEAQIWGWPVTTLNPVRTEMYMLMAEQALPGRGKRAARTLVAERDAAIAQQQVAVHATEVVTRVREAFVELLSTRETFDIYTRQAALLQDVAETATLRYAAGEGPQHHTVTTVVELAGVERARIAAEERAQQVEAKLNTLLGRPVTQPVETLAAVVPAVSPVEAEQLALARHPEVALAAAMVAREEAELARVSGDAKPDFVVGGGYMLMPGNAGAWTARAGLTWPNAPWARGRLAAAIDVQLRRVTAAKARHDVVAAQLRQTVREAAIRLVAAERQLRLIESTLLPQIDHALELSRLAYASGEGTFTEVLEARRMLIASQLDAVEARAQVARARASLDTVAGTR